MDRHEWEQRMRSGLERDLLKSHSLRKGIAVTEVRLKGRYPNTEVLILFKDDQRPNGLFGFAWKPLWDAVEGDVAGMGLSDFSQLEPESWPTVIWANFVELVGAGKNRLPNDCDPAQITWVP